MYLYYTFGFIHNMNITSAFAISLIGDHTVLMIIVVFLIANSISAIRNQGRISSLEHKLNTVLKQQKKEQLISPEVALMAKDPDKRLASIKLHRDQNPGMSIADAKSDIESLT